MALGLQVARWATADLSCEFTAPGDTQKGEAVVVTVRPGGNVTISQVSTGRSGNPMRGQNRRLVDLLLP